jgi:hypothetical protein
VNKLLVVFLVFSLLITGCAAPAVETSIVTETEAVLATEVMVATETLVATVAPSEAPTKAATATQAPAATVAVAPIEDIIEYEMKGAFNFFWEQANTVENSPGYGLIRDRYPGSEGIASIASVGYGLTAYLVGIEKGYITYDEGYERVNKTLNTLLGMDRVEGFYFHFVSMETGKRAWNSEVSNIDTSILLMGVLAAGEYFGGEIQAKAKEIYDGVNWPWFIDESKNMFYMAYRPEESFAGHWDFYAEQLMMYILGAGSDTYPMDYLVYYAFTRHNAKYGEGKPFIHSWFGSIFTYQFTHAWIDFRDYVDLKEVNWYDNSVEATLAHYNFAVDMDEKYETLGPNAWGLSASDGPSGYNGLYGAPPSGFDDKQHKVDDTIPPYGAIASIIFLPEQSQQAMQNYYSIEQLKGEYGFKDAYNLPKDWYAPDVIGIDKGISLLMLANYQDDIVYKIMMKNKNILQGMDRLQITKK